MKLFANWRNVGRAMLDARRREGVTVTRDWDERSEQRVITWWRGIDMVVIAFDGDTYQLGVDTDSNWLTDGHFESAGTALRVLAALDLIRADIAYAADERYGRCQVCGRLARWVDDGEPWGPRWIHVFKGHERFVDYPNHLAEVADAATGRADTQERDA